MTQARWVQTVLLLLVAALLGVGLGWVLWRNSGYHAAMVLRTPDPCFDLQFSPDGQRIIARYPGKPKGTRIILWNLANGQSKHLYAGDQDCRPYFVFSTDGTAVAGALSGAPGVKPTVLVWDCQTGETRASYPGFSQVLLYDKAFCALDRTREKLVNLATMEAVFEIPHDDSTNLVIENNVLLMRTVQDGAPNRGLPKKDPDAAPNEKYTVVAPAHAKLLEQIPTLGRGIDPVYLSRDGRFAAYTERGQPLQEAKPVWLSSQGERKTFPRAICAGVSPCGTMIVTESERLYKANEEPTVHVVEVATGTTLWSWPGGFPGRLSPDGTMLAVCTFVLDLSWGDRAAISVYRLPPGKPWLRIVGWSLVISVLAFMAGRKLLQEGLRLNVRNWFRLHPEPSVQDVRFRLFGVPIRISPGFWLIHGAIGGWFAWSIEPMFFFLWLGCALFSILLHEFGHICAGRWFGARGEIVLTILGGLALGCAGQPQRWQRIVVYSAGPAAQLLLGVILLPIFFSIDFAAADAGHDVFLFLLLILPPLNIGWALLNLLPIPPLDGGMIMRELTAGAV